jgi:hypothetical protein
VRTKRKPSVEKREKKKKVPGICGLSFPETRF